jgi:hypothetical protein
VLVAARLAGLRGPASGVVELPLSLYWSAPDRAFSLGDSAERRKVYEIMVREARRPGDLAVFLDGGTLIALWPHIVLPESVRRAWEDEHPALRPAPPLTLLSVGLPSRLAAKLAGVTPGQASASRPPSPPRELSGLAGNPSVP